MRTFSRDAKSSYYKYQSLPRNLTQEKRLQELHALKEDQVKVGIYKYSTHDQLGKGFSSKVYKAVQIENIHKRYAIKAIELKKFRGSNLQMLQAEIDIHKSLIHENIVRLYEVVKTPYFYYIVLEYCPHGNLHEYIGQKKKLSESNAAQIMDQILAGARYLMEQGVIHRDLKPANILRFGNKWKISDFGFSVKSRYGFKDRINVGTPLYMSPQSLKKSYYSAKTDIYSLGIILYQMLDGKTPFESRNEKQLLQKIKHDIVIPESIKNVQIRQFIEKCCQINEAKRMSREELLQFQVKMSQFIASQKESMLVSTFSRTFTYSRRPSILSEQGRYEEEVWTQDIELLYNEFLLVRHLYSCIKNIDSFLLRKEVKYQMLLVFFKLLLKLIHFLCDKKQNNFNLKYWTELLASKSYSQLYQKMLNQSQIYQKQFLEQIKCIDIKTIRGINRKFPDLCSNGKISDRFYQDFSLFLIDLIRSHNHQLMLLYNSSDANKELLGNTKQPNTLQIQGQNPTIFYADISQNIPTIVSKVHLPQQKQKPSNPAKKDGLYIGQVQLINPYMLQLKNESKFLKKIPKSPSNRSKQKQNSNRNGKQFYNHIDEPKVSLISNKTVITLTDKYQALQSLFTIYRVCELRLSNEDKGELGLQKIKVVENYLQSKLEAKDYLDLRRLLRSI